MSTTAFLQLDLEMGLKRATARVHLGIKRQRCTVKKDYMLPWREIEETLGMAKHSQGHSPKQSLNSKYNTHQRTLLDSTFFANFDPEK